jgi:hypothetical protein
MRALRFYKIGSLDDCASKKSRCRVLLPRIPGRDFAGVVVGGSDELSGQSVFGSGGNLGFEPDGSHAEYVAVPANAVCLLPRNLGFEQAAGVGVAYITAGLRRENDAAEQNDGMLDYLDRHRLEFRLVAGRFKRKAAAQHMRKVVAKVHAHAKARAERDR